MRMLPKPEDRTRRGGFAGSRRLLCAICLAALAAQGCVSAAASGTKTASSAEIAELKQRLLELQRQVTVNEVEIKRLRRALTRSGGQAPPPRRPIDESRGIPGEPLVDAAIGTEGAAFADVEERIEESDLAPESFGRPASPVEPAAPTPSPETRPVSAAAQALYDEGYTLYHQGRYAEAESRFQSFRDEYGSTELADNAQYWIGVSRYSRGEYQGALRAFRSTIEVYPTGNKVPDALLKAGQSLEALGDVENARLAYQELERLFSGSAAAARAREFLLRLQ